MQKLRRLGLIVIVCAVVLATVIILYKRWVYQNQSDEQHQLAAGGTIVQTARVKFGSSQHNLSLIGEARSYTEATLYAKISGYLRDIPVDKGDRVKKGQLIASIISDETDRDYLGAKAEAENKRAIANRMKALRAKELISPQEAEQAEADARVAESHRDSEKVLKSYENIVAPFDGVITARYADPGALVQSASSSQTAALPLVRLSQVAKLRIYVYLDQKDASFVQVGDPVNIRVDEKPGHITAATISRISGQLDTGTRMLLAEIDVDNAGSAILPGSFVHVDLKTKFTPLLEVPAEALVFQQNKNQVAVVENNVIHYRDVVIQFNDGHTAQITSGLKEGEVVALNIGTSLNDKSKVQPLPPAN